MLTTDLRIFALIRLGIFDNANIAKILEYSEKTIYVYRMRMKAKALIHGEEFEQRIMAIKAIDADWSCLKTTFTLIVVFLAAIYTNSFCG